MTHPAEEWRPVVGYEGLYEVSDHGRVKRVAPRRTGDSGNPIKVPTIAPSGYPTVSLYKKGTAQVGIAVHRLVAAAFIGPCPAGKEVNHRDGDRQKNTPGNIEYVTRSENHLHAYANLGKTRAAGERNGHATITDDTVRAIRKLREVRATTREIMRQTGASKSAIDHILAGRSWRHLA